MKRVIWLQELPQTTAGLMGLVPTLVGKLDSVIGDGLVDIAVFCMMVRDSFLQMNSQAF